MWYVEDDLTPVNVLWLGHKRVVIDQTSKNQNYSIWDWSRDPCSWSWLAIESDLVSMRVGDWKQVYFHLSCLKFIYNIRSQNLALIIVGSVQ